MNGSTVLSFEKVCYCCHITMMLEENGCHFLLTVFTHIPNLLGRR
jgi:hypothetical protein